MVVIGARNSYWSEVHRLKGQGRGPVDRGWSRIKTVVLSIADVPDLAKIARCESTTEPFGDVPYTYMQAVADINLGKQWKDADFPVLVIYGSVSPVTTAHQGQALAETIN